MSANPVEYKTVSLPEACALNEAYLIKPKAERIVD